MYQQAIAAGDYGGKIAVAVLHIFQKDSGIVTVETSAAVNEFFVIFYAFCVKSIHYALHPHQKLGMLTPRAAEEKFVTEK